MRRRLLAAAAVLALGGCYVVCWDEPTACVATRNATYPEYCYEIPTEVCLDPDVEPLPPAAECTGVAHGDTTCEDLGFTEPCSGDYFVRPGTVC